LRQRRNIFDLGNRVNIFEFFFRGGDRGLFGFGTITLRRGLLDFLRRAVLWGDVFYDVHEVICTAAEAAIEVMVLG
jgi:hypothetical protein